LPPEEDRYQSTLVFPDAIAAAGKYKSKFKASELENDFQVDVEGISFLVASRTLNLLRLE
jgi:hypothetical protein